MFQLPDHPHIRHAERTGFAPWISDDTFRCHICGNEFCYDEGERDGSYFVCYECLGYIDTDEEDDDEQ